MVISLKSKRPPAYLKVFLTLYFKSAIPAIYYALTESRVSQDFAGLNANSQHFSEIKEGISLGGEEQGINVIQSNKQVMG